MRRWAIGLRVLLATGLAAAVACRPPVPPEDSRGGHESLAPDASPMLPDSSRSTPGHLAAALSQMRIDSLIRAEMKDKGIPGAALCVMQGGEVFAAGFGEANLGTHEPVTPSTLFNIASVSKSLTALLLAQMADEGLLDLGRPIGQYWSGLQPRLSRVTAAQLLTHTAGLVDEPPTPEAIPPDQNWPEALGRVLQDRYLILPPARLFSYSSCGYVVAAGVAAHVLGRPFPELMREKVFGPAGMGSTTFYPSLADSSRLATGYGAVQADSSLRRIPPVEELRILGASGVYTSVEDLGRLFGLLINQGRNAQGAQVFSPAAVAALMSPRVAIDYNQKDEHYGLGFFIRRMENGTLIYHPGSTDGYDAIVQIVPQRGYVWVSLSNLDFKNLSDAG